MEEKYTTGQLAKLCGLTIRTIQFYDKQGLLVPKEYTDGNRRLYGEEERHKLELICVYKNLGLTLAEIKEIVLSNEPSSNLLEFINSQKNRIEKELNAKKEQLEKVSLIEKRIKNGQFNENTIKEADIFVSNRKKMRGVYALMLVGGIIMDLIQIGFLVVSLLTENWWWFGGGLIGVVVIGLTLTYFYFKKAEYVCQHCAKIFKAPYKAVFLAKHTPNSRYLKCPHCNQKSYCKEIYKEK